MRLWPWGRREVETRAGYSDVLLQLLRARAEGEDADLLATAAVEQAAGAVGRAFASVTVEGAPHIVEALTPATLARIGRDVTRYGQSLHVVRVRGGRVALLPAASWDVEGGADPATWRVHVTLDGPSASETARVPWESVTLLTWATDAHRPHEGRSGVSYASETARTASNAERAAGDEAGQPVGSIVAIPAGSGEDVDELQAAIAKLRGDHLLAETTATGWQGDRREAPRRDWVPQRLGGNPPEGTVTARREAQEDILGALGIPPALYSPRDGTAAREGLRRFTLLTLDPLLRALRAEVADKLEGEVRFRYDPMLSDLVGRSNALKTLVEAGVPLDEARTLVALDRLGIVG